MAVESGIWKNNFASKIRHRYSFRSLAHIHLEFVTNTAEKRFKMCLVILNVELFLSLGILL